MACASSCKFELLSLALCSRFVLLSIIMYAVNSTLSIGSRVEGIVFLWLLIWHIQLLFLTWPAFCVFSLAVRDLSNLVKPEDIIISENLITLLAIIPKYSQKDWLASYETLTSYVVRFVSFHMLQSVVPSLRCVVSKKLICIFTWKTCSLRFMWTDEL